MNNGEKYQFGFDIALENLRKGEKVARVHWKNVKAIFLVNGSTFNVNRAPLLGIFAEGTEVKYNPHIDMIAVDGSVGVWNASNSDILANDWVIVTNDELNA